MPNLPAMYAKLVTTKVGPNLPHGDASWKVEPGNHGGVGAIAVWQNYLFLDAMMGENYANRLVMDKDGNWLQSGWYLEPFRGVFASATALLNGAATIWLLTDTLKVVRHNAHPSGLNSLKHEGISKYSATTFSVQGPIPSIPNPDAWKSNAGSCPCDIDCNGTILAVSYRDHNQVRLLNPSTGALLQTVTVTAPRGVTVNADGSIVVCTGNEIRKFNSASVTTVATTSSVIYTTPAITHRVDNDDTYYYLATQGSDQRCYVIRKSDNGLHRVDGVPGGWQYGLFNGLNYRGVIDITADGTNSGGYYAVEHTAPRRIIHRTNSNSLSKEWRGPMQWAAPGCFNPDDVREVLFRWTSDHLVLMQATDDLLTWTVKAVWNFNHPQSGAGFGGGGEGDFYIRNKNGNTYFCRRADRDISVLKLDRSNYSLKTVFNYSCYETSKNAFQWTDANGDGVAQDNEFTYGQSANYYQDVGMVSDDEMNYYQVRRDGLYYIPLQGFNAAGSPLYDFLNAQKFYSMSLNSQYLQVTGMISIGPSAIFFAHVEQSSQQMAMTQPGASWSLTGLNEILIFERSTRQFLRKATAVTKARSSWTNPPLDTSYGEISSIKNIRPWAHADVCVINDFVGDFDGTKPAKTYTINKLGEWGLGLYETRDTSKPVWEYVGATEAGSGDVRRRSSDGKVFALEMRESLATIHEISGGPAGWSTPGTGVEPEPQPEPVAIALPARFNAGGSAVAPYAADAYFVGGTATSVTQTIDTTGVSGAGPMALYQSERYGKDGISFSYDLLMEKANQDYQVKLHFAESWVEGRKFHIENNNQRLVTDLCVAQEAGGLNKALVKTYNVRSNANKRLIIDFIKGSVDWPKVNGIEIVGEVVVTPQPPPPGQKFTQVIRIMVNINGQLQPMTVRLGSKV